MTQAETARIVRGPYRNLWIVLALVVPAALLGFGKSYLEGRTFSDLTFSPLIHVHAALMVLWLLILIGQAWFISTKRYRLHRWVGRSSYVIAPLIIVMTAVASHATLNRRPEITELDARVEIYDLFQVIGFGLSWALALVYVKRTPIHVRFMVSTVFAMGNAIVFRAILNLFSSVPGISKGTSKTWLF